MTISLKTQKMLWGRAANRCAICKMELVLDASETDDESIVGEACHIVAQSEDGPRGESDLTTEQRDKFSNLILLCNVHHKQIDDQSATFTIETLKKLKSEHESWVTQQLGLDTKKQHDDELYASYVEEWESRLKLDEWNNWASDLLSHGQPSLVGEHKVALEQIRPWLLSRVWPGRYPELESAFLNFRQVAQDFCNLFNEHAKNIYDDEWETEKFYHIDQWDPELYRKLADEFHYHVALVEDMALELTRAANYVCDRIRHYLMRSYRIKEGILLIQSGPHMDLTFKTYRVEYRDQERVNIPYPGLEQFQSVRFNRDLYFGSK